MNEENVKAPPMADPPQIEVKKRSYVTVRYLYFFENDKANIKWSWGSAVLAYLFYNLGAGSRTDGKQFAAYTTFIESWIFAHFPNLPGIPKQQYSDAGEYCTRWKWGLSITDRTGACDLLKYREAFNNYKVEDVVWDPYRAERKSEHNFNENTLFNGLTSSPDHVDPIYPNRVVQQFGRIQPIPKSPKCVEVSGLRTWNREDPKQYKPKYDWVDVFSKGLWKEWIVRSRDRGRRLRGGPAQSCHPIGRLQNKQDNYGVQATECEQLRVRIEQMKEDKTLNDVVHEQYTKSFEELPVKLEEKTKECEALNEQNAKLVNDLRIQAAVDDCNASLSRELAKKLAVIPKGEAVPSRDLQKNIDELTVKYEDAVKRLKEKELFIIASNYRWTTKYKSDTAIHDKKIETLEAWRQAIKKEFYSGQLAEKDDPTFIKLFD
ncbi:hypothetical protein GIB67_026030 [Kingdonia uniflora]|uniref:Aminotransferase-like plant mobile domain-containing protein n=1 Tax=Kingdonia uniflora TaxID=39325 RepID=A0A7J7M315_9MAGN|nr:hypothetical protein GIB67_026030 [Kingdonia uniflora]